MLVNDTDGERTMAGLEGCLQTRVFRHQPSYRVDKTTELFEESKTYVALSIRSLSTDNLKGFACALANSSNCFLVVSKM